MIFPYESEPSTPVKSTSDDSKKIAGLLAGAFAYHYGDACRVTATEDSQAFLIHPDVAIISIRPGAHRVTDTPYGMVGRTWCNMPSISDMFDYTHMFPDYAMMHATVTHLAWGMMYLRWALVHAATSGFFNKERLTESFDKLFEPTDKDEVKDLGINVPMVAQLLAQDLIQGIATDLGVGSLPKDRIAVAEHILGKENLTRKDFVLAGRKLVKLTHSQLTYSPKDVMGAEYWDSLLALIDYGCIIKPPYPWEPMPAVGLRVAVDPHQCLSYIDHHH